MTISVVVILIALMLAIFNLIGWPVFWITLAVVAAIWVVLRLLIVVLVAGSLTATRH